MSEIKLGVIGYGRRARSISDLLCRTESSVRIVAVADPNADAIGREMSETAGGRIPNLYRTADEMLDQERLHGVVIGTRCSLHTQMAVKVLSRRIPVFLEKPVATSLSDLQALNAAGTAFGGRTPPVVVSFPLRVSALVASARQILESGRLGAVQHVEAWNNVPYGAVYFQTWYRDESETGGLFLQKATHDLDYINSLLVGDRPVKVCAMTTKTVFRGDHAAGLRCMDCSERRECYESPYHPSRPAPLRLDQPSADQCAFATDTGNEDAGSALVMYEFGIHAAYTQNFVVRRKAGRRGATVIGYRGTLEFDFTTQKLTVMHHHSPVVETHEIELTGHHNGGDEVLAKNFIDVIRGNAAPVATLEDGITSALLCLKARDSARHSRFEDVALP